MHTESQAEKHSNAQKAQRIAIFASGGGSNAQAIINYFATAAAATIAEVALLVSNRRDAGALSRATAAGVPTHVIDDVANGADLLATLRNARIDLLVLTGYLKLVPEEVVQAFSGRMLNVHPALLPAFGGHGMYGQRVHAAVIASGAKFSGVTVHFVSAEYDRGPIAAQWPVPVLDNDTPQTLAERVLHVEHRLLPAVVEAVATGAITLAPNGRASGSLPANSAFAVSDATLFLR
jgi:formyltetrahydrofolate-dependent phosphoribosylglycinamide formyltransferase